MDPEMKRQLREAMAMSLGKLSALGFFPPGEAHGFKFSTEAFFLAVKAVGTFFVPLFDEFHLQQRALAEGRGGDDVAAYRVRLHAEGWVCHLEDPVLLENAGKVASFAAKWLLHQMADGDFAPGDPRAGSAPKERMAALPANLVKNACDVWSCLARASDGRRGAACFGDQDAAAAALFCCELMRRPDLVASPVVHAKLVEFLTQLLRTARGPASRKAEASLFFGPGRGLAGAVMDSERVRRELPPALVHLYGEVHAVVGLDVDADQAALVAEAADYRVAMLGLRDAGADVRGVDRDDLEDAFLVLYSSSTKATARAEAHERRVVNLLEAKRKRYEMVYVDVSPERRGALDAAAPGAPLPALLAGGAYLGDYDAPVSYTHLTLPTKA